MLKVKTRAGNTYAWDNNVGVFIPMTPALSAIIDSRPYPNSVSDEDILFYNKWMKKWKNIRPNTNLHVIPKKVHTSDIRPLVMRNGLGSMALGITEDCNFRCKYCAYSGNYEYERIHTDKYMHYSTAQKAIDNYFLLINEGKRFHPTRKPIIGFYGGEPLLNFNLIKKCVEYIQSKYNDYCTEYSITSNGSLLSKKKADWLMNHDFLLLVSIDGPKEEHDRNRVYLNGEGTFRDVMKNVDRIMDAGYKRIFSSLVYDWKSDLFKLNEFFDKTNIPPLQSAAIVNKHAGCKYYNQFTEEDQIFYLKRLEEAKRYYYNMIKKNRSKRPSFFDHIFNFAPKNDLCSAVSISPFVPQMPFTRACIPGRRIFVDTDGDYHLCERIAPTHPIGNADDGLDYEKICEIINTYHSCLDRCTYCKVSRMCTICYPVFESKAGMSCTTSKLCNKVELDKRDAFAESLSLAEKLYPDLFFETDFKYKNVRNWWRK